MCVPTVSICCGTCLRDADCASMMLFGPLIQDELEEHLASAFLKLLQRTELLY